jgi:hypothetical protein
VNNPRFRGQDARGTASGTLALRLQDLVLARADLEEDPAAFGARCGRRAVEQDSGVGTGRGKRNPRGAVLGEA